MTKLDTRHLKKNNLIVLNKYVFTENYLFLGQKTSETIIFPDFLKEKLKNLEK